ncbi:hypothetical protein A3D11_01975 [Candidatus Peribacteria bacterium RIFCSPHIGHO2_02_FULL_49_16]|nr:MAG: hypothetical protein A2880_01085 [Candidatus Peribacteria bacterium RIFCSPHIGHO2_01_FULL_49_38]OGJ58683.1 MAG: hypothetical protein A3D11_01975 [Candidatus Peribacteria bacterium RIFCSPHIGHO2_02_FULL_49_16]
MYLKDVRFASFLPVAALALAIANFLQFFSTSTGQISLTGVFSDVPLHHPNIEAIDYLAEKNLVSGYPDGTFQPERLINRAELTKIVTGSVYGSLDIENCLNTISSSDLYAPNLLFSDTALHHWFSKYVCIAKLNRFIGGYPDGTFRPDITINFAEAAKILSLGFQIETSRTNDSNPWYRGYVQDIANENAIPLSIQRFDQSITRGEMAEMIYRLDANLRTLPSRTYDEIDI